MDDTDEKILIALKQDARIPVAKIAADLGLARSTVQARIERLERTGVIGGYTYLPGSNAARPMIHATGLLQIEPRTQPAVLSRLKSLPEVARVNTVSGRFDLIVEISADTTERLDRALDAIGEVPGVKSSESFIHLSTRIERRR